MDLGVAGVSTDPVANFAVEQPHGSTIEAEKQVENTVWLDNQPNWQ